MAKIDFTKVEFPQDNTVQYNDEVITIKSYVPIQEKIEAVQTILSLCLNPDMGIYIPSFVEVYRKLFVFKIYTDIEFTDEDIDNPMPVYDALKNLSCYEDIMKILKVNGDVIEFYELLNNTIYKLEKYQTSAYGILDSLKKDYNNLNLDIDALQEKIKNKEGLELVDEVVKKLG
jgi:hypothetical protein